MNKHDIINDADWLKLLASNKRKAELEIVLLAIGVVVLFSAFCSPVFFQYVFGLGFKG